MQNLILFHKFDVFDCEGVSHLAEGEVLEGGAADAGMREKGRSPEYDAHGLHNNRVGCRGEDRTRTAAPVMRHITCRGRPKS